MRAKTYLQQIEKLDAIIINKMAEKVLWESLAMSIVPQAGGERVQSSGSQQKMADAVGKYLDIEQDIADREKERKEIISVIEQISYPDFDILYKIYVLRKDLTEVADEHNRSYSWVTTRHGIALAKVQAIIDSKGNKKEV